MKLITFLLSCICLSSYGQDYLVTNKGDTLRGTIKPMSYDLLDRVQVSQNKKKTTLTGLQVRVFLYDGHLYHPIRRENTIRFMQLLKPGYLSLYAYRFENQSNFDGRLLVKRGGSMLDVPNLNFKKLLSSFLTECSTVREKVMSGDYGRKNLDQVINEFNACVENGTLAVMKADSVAVESNRKALPLEDLKKTVAGLQDFNSKKDALDLINDMLDKVKGSRSIPNYQMEALKGFLQGNETTKDGLEKVLTMLKTN